MDKVLTKCISRGVIEFFLKDFVIKRTFKNCSNFLFWAVYPSSVNVNTSWAMHLHFIWLRRREKNQVSTTIKINWTEIHLYNLTSLAYSNQEFRSRRISGERKKSIWAVRVINQCNVYSFFPEVIYKFMEKSLHLKLTFIALALDWIS